MSNTNPFSPPSTSVAPSLDLPPTVPIDPIDLYKRSFALMGDQYWLFVGIALVGILIGSVIPLGILMGPMMVGIYLCFMDRERGQKVEFATLFKGFDQFANALIAMLIIIGVAMAVIIPCYILMAVALIATNGSGTGLMVVLFGVAMIFALSMAIYLPFLFVFQLIAERGLTGPQAVSLSFKAMKANLVGCISLLFVMGVASILAALACYFPAFLLMPISFGALFLAYRDIFGPRPV